MFSQMFGSCIIKNPNENPDENTPQQTARNTTQPAMISNSRISTLLHNSFMESQYAENETLQEYRRIRILKSEIFHKLKEIPATRRRTREEMLGIIMKKPDRAHQITDALLLLHEDLFISRELVEKLVDSERVTEALFTLKRTKICIQDERLIDTLHDNQQVIDEMVQVFLILNREKIIMTKTLADQFIKVLIRHGQYADDVAIAFVYLHKCNIPLTQSNIEDIANAGPRAWDAAVAIAWFSLKISSDYTMSALISALTENKAANLSDTRNIFLMLECLLPLTTDLIQAIARTRDSTHFLKVISDLKKEGITPTDEDIATLAKSDCIDRVADELRSRETDASIASDHRESKSDMLNPTRNSILYSAAQGVPPAPTDIQNLVRLSILPPPTPLSIPSPKRGIPPAPELSPVSFIFSSGS